MSHYSYKNKKVVETSKGDIFVLAMVSDSSVRGSDGRQVWTWSLCNLKRYCIVYPKEEHKQLAEEAIKEQHSLMQEYENKYGRGLQVTEDQDTYYGNVYPGGRSLKAMKAFLSARRTIPVEKFFAETATAGFDVNFSVYSRESFNAIGEYLCAVHDEESLYRAQEQYEELRKNNPGATVYIGIWGLPS